MGKRRAGLFDQGGAAHARHFQIAHHDPDVLADLFKDFLRPGTGLRGSDRQAPVLRPFTRQAV
jgi:hypothetical protein